MLFTVAAESDVDGAFFTIADDGELDGVARGVFADEGGNGASFADGNAVDFGDDIFFFQARFVGWAIDDDS